MTTWSERTFHKLQADNKMIGGKQCMHACGGHPGFLFSSSWITNVDETKDLWCSSTVRLLSTQTWVNVKALRLSLNYHAWYKSRVRPKWWILRLGLETVVPVQWKNWGKSDKPLANDLMEFDSSYTRIPYHVLQSLIWQCIVAWWMLDGQPWEAIATACIVVDPWIFSCII